MMKPDEYTWNEHERQLYIKNKIMIPSPYKIKITDDENKRNELEEILEKLKNDIIFNTSNMLQKRIDGKVSAFALRNAGFLANTLARNSISEISKFSSRVYAQAIATGHMRGHAIVSSDYAVKVVNLLNSNSKIEAVNERNKQMELLRP